MENPLVLLRELVASPPWEGYAASELDRAICQWCNWDGESSGDHLPDCPYRRAKEFLDEVKKIEDFTYETTSGQIGVWDSTIEGENL